MLTKERQRLQLQKPFFRFPPQQTKRNVEYKIKTYMICKFDHYDTFNALRYLW